MNNRYGFAAVIALLAGPALALELTGVPGNVLVDCDEIPPPANVVALSTCSVASASAGASLYYSFESIQGGLVPDVSGHGHVGTINGATAAAGRFGQGMYFDANGNDSIDIGQYFDLGGSVTAVTACLWFKAGLYVNPSWGASLINKEHDQGPYTGWALRIEDRTGDGSVDFWASDNARAWVKEDTSSYDNQWHFITGIFEKTSHSIRSRLYMDGIYIGVLESETTSSAATDARLRLGNRDPNNSEPLKDATLDEVRIYERVLTPEEISALMQNNALPGDSVPVQFSETAVGACPAETITRVWTASDTCGNSVGATQVISVADTDNDLDDDGLKNNVETDTGVFVSPDDTGSDPANPDTDGDGRHDGFEVVRGTDPNDPTSFSSPTLPTDFDGDLRSDSAVFDPHTGGWYLRMSHDGFASFNLGKRNATVMAICGDFNGDGRSDVGTYEIASGNWTVSEGSAGIISDSFHTGGAFPLVADFDGDGRADLSIFLPNGTWQIHRSSQGDRTVQFGFAGTLPVVGDTDGDGKADLAVFDPAAGQWYVQQTSAGFFTTQFGFSGAVPILEDFDGDGRADLCIFDPGAGRWYIQATTEGFKTVILGFRTTTPVPGDYDGDGRVDEAIYFAGRGIWYELLANNSYKAFKFGYKGTKAVGAADYSNLRLPQLSHRRPHR